MGDVIDIINYDNFKFIVLPGSNPPPQYQAHYDSAYRCWLKVWGVAYNELGVSRHLYSDDFTRQTELNCIFYGSTCIGILFLKQVDFSSAAVRDDSYFKLWSDKELDSLIQYGPEILVCSNTTIAEEWRRKSTKLSMKDLIVYFSAQRFVHSTASAMTAVTRKTRGIHKLTERFGAQVLKADVPNFNATDLVDLCAFYKHTITEGTDPVVIEFGRKLWKEMIVVHSNKTILTDKNNSAKKIA
jgi:hypothetical protein